MLGLGFGGVGRLLFLGVQSVRGLGCGALGHRP